MNPDDDTTQTTDDTTQTTEVVSNGSDWTFGGKGEFKLAGGKYESVEKLDEAYTNLQKLQGAFTGAPKDGYDLKIDEELPVSDSLLEKVKARAAEMNMSQEGLQGFIDDFLADETSVTEEAVKAEMALLGDDSAAQVKDLEDRIYSMFDEERATALIRSITTASAAQAMQELFAQIQPTISTDELGAAIPDVISKEDLDKLRYKTDKDGNELYMIDKEHRAKVDAIFKKKYGTQPQRVTVG